MLADLLRALPAGAAAVVLPGYFWALVLRPASGIAERLAYSTGLSMAAVPAVAVLLARVTSSGIGLWTALASVLIVFGSGLVVYRLKGASQAPAAPLLPRPGLIRDPVALTILAVALVLAIAVTVDQRRLPGVTLVVLAAVLLGAGAFAVTRSAATHADDTGAANTGAANTGAANTGAAATDQPAGDTAPPSGDGALAKLANPRMADIGLAAVLAVTGLIAYAGVIRVDWPFIPGGDQFSHAVMAEQMLAHGQYHAYLVYPPGFSALTAVICRFAGLAPLALFPVLAPTMLLLPPLATYALATRLWGWRYGLGAALLAGLVFNGSYTSLMWGRYPDLVSSSFLVVMTVAALVSLYQSPTLRSGVLVAVMAASVIFYHSVATLYLVVLLALVAAGGLPYLVIARRFRDARVLALSLAGAAVLSAVYAAYIYNLPGMLGGHSAASTAVSIAVGTQTPFPASHILSDLSPALIWFGLIGFAFLAVSIRRLREPGQVMAAATLVVWIAFMYIGSRTSADGFPQRFDRDIGPALCVAGALALGVIARSAVHLWRERPQAATTASPAAVAAGCTAAVLAVLLLAGQFVTTVERENHRWGEILTPADETAGRWLARHNTGGTIISTPGLSPGITNRAVLALGWYTGLQSYSPKRIAQPRSLPTAGKQPLLDTHEVLLHPTSCQSGSILVRDDVRYVELYRTMKGADLAGFAADPARYRPVYSNHAIVIYAASHTGCPGT